MGILDSYWDKKSRLDSKFLHFKVQKWPVFSKKAKWNLDSLKKIQIFSFFDLTEFFHHFYNIEKKILRKKLVKMMLSNFSNFNFLKNPNSYLHFLQNLVISGPGKCKIWNLGIKISKLTKFELWEMMRSKVWFFPMLTLNSLKPIRSN